MRAERRPYGLLGNGSDEKLCRPGGDLPAARSFRRIVGLTDRADVIVVYSRPAHKGFVTDR